MTGTKGDAEIFRMLEKREISFRVFKKAINNDKIYREYTARLRKEVRQRSNEFPVFERGMALQIR